MPPPAGRVDQTLDFPHGGRLLDRPGNFRGLKSHPGGTDFRECRPIGTGFGPFGLSYRKLSIRSSGLLWPVRSSPEGPPPTFRTGRCCVRRCRQGIGHGLELVQQFLVAPVGVGQPFLVQVHQFAESFHLGLEGEVLCRSVAGGVLTLSGRLIPGPGACLLGVPGTCCRYPVRESSAEERSPLHPLTTGCRPRGSPSLH